MGIITILAVPLVPVPTFALDAGPLSSSRSSSDDGAVHPVSLWNERLPGSPRDLDRTAPVAEHGLTRLILGGAIPAPTPPATSSRAFGSLLMQGNFVIGIIVFAILVIVNFVSSPRVPGRIAEVSACFTLDAMPGKRMAVDADLCRA